MAPTQSIGPSERWAVAIICVVVVFTITSTASIILRLVAKKRNKQQLSWEDYTIFLAQFGLYIFTVLSIMAIVYGGAGHQAKDLPPSMVATFVKLLLAVRIFHTITVSLVKVSICLFYTRIFFTNTFALASRISISIIIGWMLAAILTIVLICSPLSFYWDHSIPGGKCGNQRAAFTTIGSIDLVTDIVVFMLPVPMIWRLQISKGNKVALTGVFGLGISTVVICIMRVLTLVRVDQNITYSAAPPLLWSFLEPGVGITVACGPLVGPLLRGGRWIKGNTTKSSRTGGSSSHFERIRDPPHRMQSIHAQNATSTTDLGPIGAGSGVASDSKSISKSLSSSQRSVEYNPMGLRSGFDK